MYALLSRAIDVLLIYCAHRTHVHRPNPLVGDTSAATAVDNNDNNNNNSDTLHCRSRRFRRSLKYYGHGTFET